jgi:uncharacterized UPF0160 family protein
MKRIVTHSGGFHADDVFAVATLLFIYPDAEIIRSRDDEVINGADIVVDVGSVYNAPKLKFDHHQKGGAGERENKIPFASFGLVWKEFGEKISGTAELDKMIEEKLVLPIDALDNGINISNPIYENIRPFDISDYFYSYWIDEDVSEEELLKIFKSVVTLAKGLIERVLHKAKRIIEEGLIVEEIYKNTEDKKIIILDKHYAWGRVLVEKPEPLLVVYPTTDGLKWNAKVVRENLGSFKSRISFPLEWAGKSGEDFQNISGVKDALFCHNKLFLAVAASKDGAVSLANKALNA